MFLPLGVIDHSLAVDNRGTSHSDLLSSFSNRSEPFSGRGGQAGTHALGGGGKNWNNEPF